MFGIPTREKSLADEFDPESADEFESEDDLGEPMTA